MQILISCIKIGNISIGRRKRDDGSIMYRDACTSCSQRKRERERGRGRGAEAKRRERSVRIDNPCTRYIVHNLYETRTRERERERE